MNCSRRLWWKLFRRCGSDYFAGTSTVQTCLDGRVTTLAQDHLFPFVMHLTCVECGARYVFPDRRRAKTLIPASSPEARVFLDQDRQHFDRSFDPRQAKESQEETKACPTG